MKKIDCHPPVANRGEHSSRRQQLQQRCPNTTAENNSDIEGTAHRVASVTLNTESDSRTSADLPAYPFRSKRRKKLPRRDKQQGADMDVDEHQPPWKKLSVNTVDNLTLPSCKVQMDWEHGHGQALSATNDSTQNQSSSTTTRQASDMENSVSDQFSHSQSESEASTSNIDADDEQSDWPGNELARHPQLSSSSSVIVPFQLAPPQQRVASSTNNKQQKDAAPLSAEAIKRIECFLQSADDKELVLDKVCRTSAVKQVLRRQFANANVQIVKRGRGTVALKKL
ncbi:hypothetical protein niasHS_001734 [Heterodera schachtii]|uniref:Uncharacterized protein n=1 Tax=Heterodera schachtii TaxID=97005 RepID=A0ABD2KC34_HETSC